MTLNSCRLPRVNLRAATVLTGLIVTSCAPQYSSPQQVQASNPTVTYKYHNDQELIEVNQTAVTFCNQYRAAPATGQFHERSGWQQGCRLRVCAEHDAHGLAAAV